MTGQGISQIVVYASRWSRSATRSGSGWRASSPRSASAAACSARSRAASSASSARTRQGAGLEELRHDGARLQRPLLGRPLRDPAAAGPPVPEPGPHEGRAVAPVAEHGRQLHHEHELAVLRRRVHDVVPDPDGRARGAELRLRRGRDRRARRRRSAGSRAARPARSATSGSTSTARSSTSCCRSR